MTLRWRKRSDATVFVDDYVTGHLPLICVLSGQPADSTLTYRSSVNSPSPAWWLLVFLGPLGWIGLFLVLVRSDRRPLVGQLPISRSSWQHLLKIKRSVWALAGAALVLFLLATRLADGVSTMVFVAPASVCLVTALGVHLWLQFQWPTIVLDASGRWVTIAAVHPEFARAVRRQQRTSNGVRPQHLDQRPMQSGRRAGA